MANPEENAAVRMEWDEPADFFPSTLEVPMPESNERHQALQSIVLPLKDRYAHRADVSVEATLMLFNDESNIYS